MAAVVMLEQYYPGWDPYEGTYEATTWRFTGPPEQIAPASKVAQLAAGYTSVFRNNGETLMYMKVEADWHDFYATQYKVTTYSHPSTAGSGIGLNVGWVQFLVAAIIAMAAVIALIYASHVVEQFIKVIGPQLPRLIDLGFWAVAGTVFVASIWLIFGGKEAKRG